MPSYPSLTFPNHFTIVTGLYPEHHGIVANSFLDPARGARYSYTEPQTATDGSWYSGVPIVEPGREPGNAHGVPALGRLARPRSPASGPRITHNSTRKHSPRRKPNRRASTTPSPCCVCPPRTARISSPSTSPNLTTRATSSAPMRAKPGPPRSRWTRSLASWSRAQSHRPAHRLVVIVSDHGMVKSEGDWINLDQFADLDRIRSRRRTALRQDRRGSRARLQPAQACLIAIHGLPAEGCSGRPELQPESARGRPGGGGHRALCDSRSCSAGGQAGSPAARRACTASIRTSCPR